jgi:Holliday junction resolvasome RuvABC endonuclease subunit
MFVDPASISTGWAYVVDGFLHSSGSISAPKGMDVFARLSKIYHEYFMVIKQLEIDEIHIERLPMKCHHMTHWSVGVVGAAGFQGGVAEVFADISPSAWQKAVGWKTVRGKKPEYVLAPNSPLRPLVSEVKSTDELAACGLAIYWLQKNGGGK